MSFIVSFKGQFSPYKLPDLSSASQRLHRIQKANTIDSEFESELIDKENKPKSNNLLKKTKIAAYQKQETQFQKDHKAQYAAELMSTPVKCLDENQSVVMAIEVMKKHSYRHLPILNSDGVLCGMLSERDLINVDSTGKKIHHVMTPEVLTCFEQTKITDIASIMLHERINSIPIINDNYKLTGIITQSDLLRLITKLFPLNTWS